VTGWRIHIMLRLAFGITHDSGFATDKVSTPPVWIPELESVFVPPDVVGLLPFSLK
jgi:hypothetical protein